MKIGIIGAMPEEIHAIQALIPSPNKKTMAKRDYIYGRLQNHEIITVLSGIGKVASASTATTLLNEFAPELIIFTGVAGGVSRDINVGDIVIATETYQHDMDCSPMNPRFEIPSINVTFFPTPDEYLHLTYNVVQEFLEEILETDLAPVLEKFSIVTPKAHRGIIASGDEFVKDALTNEALNIPGKNALATEMEGAAIAQVCYDYNVPLILIRTISDKADHTSPVDFRSFTDELASQYSVRIIERLLTTLNR